MPARSIGRASGDSAPGDQFTVTGNFQTQRLNMLLEMLNIAQRAQTQDRWLTHWESIRKPRQNMIASGLSTGQGTHMHLFLHRIMSLE
jgi:hypothetical protein